jgi:DNA-binding transcriptional MerR regulator
MNFPLTSVEPDPVSLGKHALMVFEPDPQASYSLETVARLAQVSRYQVALYCKYGLVTPLDPEDHWVFDAAAIRTVRRLEDLRERYGVNLAGTRLLMQLLQEIDDLRTEVRFLREM